MQKYKDKKQFRYQGYDYSQDGYYFVTICTKNRKFYFGLVVNEKNNLSDIGKIVEQYRQKIPEHFPFVKLDEFIVMPNHIHGIIIIKNNMTIGTQNLAFLQEYQNKFGPQSKNLSSIIRGFKIGVTKSVRDNNLEFNWQSRFHDRIIRNDDELNNIRQYIIDNPIKWELDRNNLDNLYM